MNWTYLNITIYIYISHQQKRIIIFFMGIMGYSKNSESVLPLQLNFDSNAQIKKL